MDTGETGGLSLDTAGGPAGILANLARVGLCVDHLAHQRNAFSALGLDSERAVEGRDRACAGAMSARLAVGDCVADAEVHGRRSSLDYENDYQFRLRSASPHRPLA